MDVNDQDSLSQDLLSQDLLSHVLELPLAFAIWKNQTDLILLSKQMQSILNVNKDLLCSEEFVQALCIFDNFLNDAASRLLSGNTTKYESKFTLNGKIYNLILIYDNKSQIFLMQIIKNFSNIKDFRILQEILDLIPLVVWKKDQDLKLNFCNKNYANIANLPIDNVIDKNIQLFHTPHKDSYLQANSIQQFTEEITTQYGTSASAHSISAQGVKIQDIKTQCVKTQCVKLMKVTECRSSIDKNQLIGFALDITALNNAQTEANLYKNRFNQVIENSSDAIALFDNDMHLVAINNLALKMFNLESFDIQNHSYIEIIDKLLANEFITNANQNFRDRCLALFNLADKSEKQIKLSNGCTLKVTAIPNDGELLLVFNDITKHLELEKKIKSIQSIYRNVLDNSTDGIFLISADNRVQLLNKVMYQIFNLDTDNKFETYRLSEFFEFVDDFFKNDLEKSNFVQNIIKSSEQRTNKTEIITSVFEKVFKYNCIALPEGLTLLKFTDISQYRNMESELKIASDKNRQITYLKSKLLMLIADEYKCPLTTVKSFTEILYNQYFGKLNNKQVEYCTGILKTYNRLNNSIEAISEIANIEANPDYVNFNETNLNEILIDIANEFNNQDIQIAIDCDPNILIYIDNKRFKMAIRHILLKSIAMIPQKDIIEIHAKYLENEPNLLQITITDHGEGFDEETVKKFKKYFASNISLGELESNELDYFLAYKVIVLHRGTVNLSSKEDHSTTVTLTLPSKHLLQMG